MIQILAHSAAAHRKLGRDEGVDRVEELIRTIGRQVRSGAEMTAELDFVLAGKDTEEATDAPMAAFDGDGGGAVRRVAAETAPEVERRAADPIAPASLIVSAPGAVLAVWDIVERIKKRRGEAVIDTAKRLKAERRVETYLLAADRTPHTVADFDADKLLDPIAEVAPPTNGGDWT